MTELVARVAVSGFRGFLAEQAIELAIPNGEPGSGMTILVGPNNGGKSSVLEALKMVSASEAPQFGRGVRNVRSATGAQIHYTFGSGDSQTLRSESANSYIVRWEPPRQSAPAEVYTVPSRRALDAHFSRNPRTRSSFQSDSAAHPSDRSYAPALSMRLVQIAEDKSAKAEFDKDVKRLLGRPLAWNLDQIESNQLVFTVEGAAGHHTSEGEPPRSFRRLGLMAQPVGWSSFLAA